ncbi:sigma factor-like helix-turn-helix DNA-binding protein [Janibacter melonis]|uniref:sigma factor-like helix-turn-helix DNA-binding protein n=1 Tax=Janibacter melonis TaxID=262209 RepID=UPI002095EF8F|nr:sigma factor-like helix-turn-helix DNA-binding protein [Janibacter melonis]
MGIRAAGAVEAEFADFVREASPGCCAPRTGCAATRTRLRTSCSLRWRRSTCAGRGCGRRPVAYARRCLVNEHTDTWRRRRRESLTEVPAEQPVTDAEPEDTRALHRMLATLAPRERQAVVLRHYVGLTEAETAQTLAARWAP